VVLSSQDGKVDLLDMSAYSSLTKLILNMLSMSSSTSSLAGSLAQLAGAFGFSPRHQSDLAGMRTLADIEAMLLDGPQQKGPQLISDYTPPR